MLCFAVKADEGVVKLTDQDFDDDHRKWSSCDPFALFDAQIVTKVEGVSSLIALQGPAEVVDHRAHGTEHATS